MAGYDQTLDVATFKETKEFGETRVTVAVYSYNNGPKKLQISRENLSNTTGQYSFSKLGRLTKEEAVAILPIIKKAVDTMA